MFTVLETVKPSILNDGKEGETENKTRLCLEDKIKMYLPGTRKESSSVFALTNLNS